MTTCANCPTRGECTTHMYCYKETPGLLAAPPTLSDTRGIWCNGCNASVPPGAAHMSYCTVEPACHAKPRSQWCDHAGPGGFMGHTCAKRTQHPAEDKRTEPFPMNDAVNHPKHYTSHPSGVECIKVVEHMNFCRGNAMKYIWRAGEKDNEIEDLKKARWYVDREIARLEAATQSTPADDR